MKHEQKAPRNWIFLALRKSKRSEAHQRDRKPTRARQKAQHLRAEIKKLGQGDYPCVPRAAFIGSRLVTQQHVPTWRNW